MGFPFVCEISSISILGGDKNRKLFPCLIIPSFMAAAFYGRNCDCTRVNSFLDSHLHPHAPNVLINARNSFKSYSFTTKIQKSHWKLSFFVWKSFSTKENDI